MNPKTVHVNAKKVVVDLLISTLFSPESFLEFWQTLLKLENIHAFYVRHHSLVSLSLH